VDRRAFVIVAGSGLVALATAAAGCSPSISAADGASAQCRANRAAIKQMFDLFYEDSGEYPPMDIVLQKMDRRCPSGGTYTFDEGTDKVTCSVHGGS
jgi:hypothetical protein